jgi:hypothetical protein
LNDLSFVVDGDDRIIQVADEQRATMAGYLGHPLWVYLPGSEPVLNPIFAEAREREEFVESTMFYAGGTVDVRVTPAGAVLAVQLRRRTELNVRTLATLAQSLRTIEAELAAREHERRDRQAPASPQALP